MTDKQTLHSMARRYEHTNNPLYVWNAIQYCADAKMDLPGWVVSYLAKVADALIFEHEPPEIALKKTCRDTRGELRPVGNGKLKYMR